MTDNAADTPDNDFPSPDPERPSQLLGFAPVPVRARKGGWTPERQRALVAAIAAYGSVRAACRAIGMAHETAYRLRLRNGAEEFRRAWDLAAEMGDKVLEDVAYDRALYGAEETLTDADGRTTVRTVHDNRLLTFMLAARDPERYCPRTRAARTNAEIRAKEKADERAAKAAAAVPPETDGEIVRKRIEAQVALIRERLIAARPDLMGESVEKRQHEMEVGTDGDGQEYAAGREGGSEREDEMVGSGAKCGYDELDKLPAAPRLKDFRQRKFSMR